MFTILVILIPLLALMIWAVVFDLKRRRRHAPLSSHDIGSSIGRARGDAEAHGGTTAGDGYSPGP